ncbi:hypothetical protein SUGI_1110100 [Cryptomeria japonica]|nr:hypothetical protein SUGI_1110100 [Cryptomeria japonica]
MGCASSKIQDDDALLRCRERKRFIKLVIDTRYQLATAHVAYIEALRNIGHSIKNFTEVALESSPSSSSAMASELAVLHEKSPSRSPFPSSTSSRSQLASPVNSLSPVNLDSHDNHFHASNASPLHVNLMRSGVTQPITVEQRPPAGARGSLESFSSAPQSRVDLDSSSSRPATPPSPSSSQKTVPPPPQPSGNPWDFFNPFASLDDHYYPADHREISHSPERELIDLENVREEEGIPDLEDGDHGERDLERVRFVEKTSRAEFADSHTHNFEIADEAGVKTDSSSQEHVATSSVDAFTQAPPKPSVEEKLQFTSKVVVEDISSIDVEADEADAIKAAEKDKEVSGKEVILDNEQQTAASVPRNINLLDGIKEIEKWFIRAYESGEEVSRMLEANKVRHHSSLTETKGRSWTSRIFIPYSICCFRGPAVPVSHEPTSMALSLLTWHRSTSSLSSSSKTHFVSIPKDDLDDSSSDYVEDLCMISGSHASTLERLYAWEKKLYDEVKAEEYIRSVYEKKCVQLRHQEAKGENSQVIDKTRAAVKDLHSRIRVGIHAVESVSMKIQKLRDDELQPQLVELIQGLIRMWEVMLEYHQTQRQIIFQTNAVGRPAVSGKFSESYQQATVHLESGLLNWCSSFNNWIDTQKAYVKALHGWFQKCLLEEVPDPSTRRRAGSLSPRKLGAPFVIIICHDWSRAFEMQESASKKDASPNNSVPKKENLDTAVKEVLSDIKSLAGDVRGICLQLDDHENQKKKAAKDLGRKAAESTKEEVYKGDYHKGEYVLFMICKCLEFPLWKRQVYIEICFVEYLVIYHSAMGERCVC